MRTLKPKITVARNSDSNSLSKIMSEAHNAFKDEHGFYPMQSITDVIASESVFDSYLGYLTEGLDSRDVPVFEQLSENFRDELLSESLTAQITPIAGLGMATIRAMWPRTAIKDIYSTEVATTPAFSISWQAPYIRAANGTKYYLPKAVIENQGLVDKPSVASTYFTTKTGNLLTSTTVNGVAASQAKHDAIDINIAIAGVKMELPDVKTAPTGAKTTYEVTCYIKRDIQGNFSGVVTGTAADAEVYTDTLFGTIDCETGAFSWVSVSGYVTAVKFKGWLTQEANNNSVSVSFDIKRKEILIGTGTHYNAPMPIEWLKDLKALYNIDGTVEVIDQISRTIAQRLDQEGADFIDESFVNMGEPNVGRFNCRPAANFTGSPTEWRKEIRTTIKWWAQKAKSISYYEDGYFVIFGNTMDIEVIPDVAWTFRADSGEEGSNAPSTYSFGVITGSHRIRVVSSDVIPAGKLRMIWIPSKEDQMTYKYYPYAFNIEKGYRDPNMSNVPSILVTKRQIFAEAVPIQVQIMIENNIGDTFSSYAM